VTEALFMLLYVTACIVFMIVIVSKAEPYPGDDQPDGPGTQDDYDLAV
jgi:hypothetical protein